MLAHNRSVNLHAPLFGFALAAVLMLGCEAEPPGAAPANQAQVQAWFARQEQHARKLAPIEGKKMAPEVWPFFAAGARGDRTIG